MTQLASVYSANLMNWNVVIQEVVPVTHDTPYHCLFFLIEMWKSSLPSLQYIKIMKHFVSQHELKSEYYDVLF